MEPTRTDSTPRGDIVTAYEFAIEVVRIASSNLARSAAPEEECFKARLVYDTVIDLYPRVRLDATQRASLLKELSLLRLRLEECEDDQTKARTMRR
jgi:hypothetical protein